MSDSDSEEIAYAADRWTDEDTSGEDTCDEVTSDEAELSLDGDCFACSPCSRPEDLQARWLARVSRSPWLLPRAPAEVQADQAVAIAAVSRAPELLERLPPELRADRAVVLAAVAQSGSALMYAGLAVRDDREVALAAVAKDGKSLRHCSPKLQSDREVVKTAVLQPIEAVRASLGPGGMKFVPFVAPTLRAAAQSILGLASRELQADPELQALAVQGLAEAPSKPQAPAVQAGLSHLGPLCLGAWPKAR